MITQNELKARAWFFERRLRRRRYRIDFHNASKSEIYIYIFYAAVSEIIIFILYVLNVFAYDLEGNSLKPTHSWTPKHFKQKTQRKPWLFGEQI